MPQSYYMKENSIAWDKYVITHKKSTATQIQKKN